MQEQRISLGRAFTQGWEAFRRDAGMAIVAYLIFTALATIASYIICVGWIAWGFFLGFVFSGGVTIFYLNMAKGGRPDIGHLFAAFNDFWKWVGVGWVFLIIVFLCLIPATFASLIAGLVLNPMREAAGTSAAANSVLASMVLLIVGGALISLLLILYFFVRYMFVWWIAAEGTGILESFGRSASLVSGRFWRLFWIFIVLQLFALSGLILLGIGQLVTYPISSLAIAALYLDVKSLRPEASMGQEV